MRQKPVFLRVLSAAAVLAMVSSCVTPALAGTYYLENGSITVKTAESGQDVTQNGTTTNDTGEVVITNHNDAATSDPDTPTNNTVTIIADEGKTAQVTLQDVNIVAKSSAAVSTQGKGTTVIELDGDNTLTGGTIDSTHGYAALEKKDAAWGKEDSGTLIIKDEDKDGKLTATGGTNSAGIGGSADNTHHVGDESGTWQNGTKCAQNIVINGGTIEATGSGEGAGIGGAADGFGKVTINGGDITATGGMQGGAGIGGGEASDWSGLGEVTINSGTVTAQGGLDAAGIGGGAKGDAHVTINGGKVEATAGAVEATSDAAGIGNGSGQMYDDSYVNITGGDVTASGMESGVGIGGGEQKAAVNITGGTITATGAGGKAAIAGDKVNITATTSDLNLQATTTGDAAIVSSNTNQIALGEEKKAIVTLMEGTATESKTTSYHNKSTSHNWVQVEEVAATCKDGYITYTCGHSEWKYETLAAINKHDWDNGQVTVEPTAEQEGQKTYTCNSCKETKTETIPMLPADAQEHTHTWQTNSTVTQPTCTKDGSTKYKCTGCDAVKITDVTPATGHAWAQTDKVEPTEDAAGYTAYKCTNTGCTETRTVEIAKLDGAHTHEWVQSDSSSSTCKYAGYIDYKCECGGEKREVQPASGVHSWDNGIIKVEPTAEQQGQKVYTCTVCGATRTEAVDYVPDVKPDTQPDKETGDETNTVAQSEIVWYRVADKDEKDLTVKYQGQVLEDTFVVTALLDEASLSGNLAFLRQLQEQGIRYIMFVSNRCVTRIDLTGLLLDGSEQAIFELVHSLSGRTLTVAGENRDDLLL